MKNERIEILQKVANGELTPKQADEQLLGLAIVTKRLNWMVEEMDKAKPFSQSYNNLNERHSRLLEAKNILDKEGLWL